MELNKAHVDVIIVVGAGKGKPFANASSTAFQSFFLNRNKNFYLRPHLVQER
jgi:hypothetical protein